MKPSIFLSHNHKDKEFVRKLGGDLAQDGIRVWIDEAEILVGDSLLYKVETAIEEMEYLGVILSKHSLQSEWVNRELKLALSDEFYHKKVKVLPILLEDVTLPGFLKDKLYADFRDKSLYQDSLRKLIKSIRRNHPKSLSYADYILETYGDKLDLRGLSEGTYREGGLRYRLNDSLTVELRPEAITFEHMTSPFSDPITMEDIYYDRRRISFRLHIDTEQFILEYLDEHWESNEYLGVEQFRDRECKTFGTIHYIYDFLWHENKLTIYCHDELLELLVMREKYKNNHKEIMKNDVFIANGIFDCYDFKLQFVSNKGKNNNFFRTLLNDSKKYI